MRFSAIALTAFEQTRAALERPGPQRRILFDSAFCHEDVRVRVRVDAFERNEHGERGDTPIEVKSTASVKDEHLWDSAIQTWVARGAGRPVRCFSVHDQPETSVHDRLNTHLKGYRDG